jgi:D-alanyl-D-alanine carboxypeptidase
LVLCLCGEAPFRSEVEPRIRPVTVRYLDFSGKVKEGIIEVDSSLAREVGEIFVEIYAAGFPVRGVRPMRDFAGDDDSAMRSDNTSGWNWREARGTGQLSWHALGRAIDLNPRENPWVRNGIVRPNGAIRDTSIPGTMRWNDAVVRAFRKRGWRWGGRWQRVRDWQHFEKPIPGVDLSIPDRKIQALKRPKA